MTGTFCAKHPKGLSGKRCLSPFSPGLRLSLFLEHRKLHDEPGHPFATLPPDGPVMGLHRLVRDEQSQPGPLRFLGDKGVEESFASGLGGAGTRVLPRTVLLDPRPAARAPDRPGRAPETSRPAASTAFRSRLTSSWRNESPGRLNVDRFVRLAELQVDSSVPTRRLDQFDHFFNQGVERQFLERRGPRLAEGVRNRWRYDSISLSCRRATSSDSDRGPAGHSAWCKSMAIAAPVAELRS